MAITPEYVLSLAKRIESAKSALASAQEEWDSIFGELPQNQPKAPPIQVPYRETNTTRVLVAVENSPVPVDASNVANITGLPLISVRKILQLLYGDEKIARAERGKYRGKQDMVAAASSAA